ncbi:MAG TPA: LysR family transcriptional regulator [Dissulfurispiraceae bacterium]|nr:LysR family transcriptional regulator [Dissulfurispiraceae bacterium]
MNFYQLTYFRKVAETGSISRAAEELLLTQPAVSKQIKALEDELGEKLFDRLGKRLFLTRSGELLYSRAEKILQSVDEAKSAVKDMSAECAGELVIGTSDHISIHRLPEILKDYITTFPKVDLKLRCHRSETVLEMVNRNMVDLGVITLPKVPPHIVSKPIWKDPMSLVYQKCHPLGSIKTPRLKDAAKYGMILPDAATETRQMIETAYRNKKLGINVTMEVAYIETIKSLVKSGLGISILPDKAMEDEAKSGALSKSKLADTTFTRNLGAVYLKDKYLSKPAKEFLNLLELSSRL